MGTYTTILNKTLIKRKLFEKGRFPHKCFAFMGKNTLPDTRVNNIA